MADIVGIGANVCDTLYAVPSYPNEDTKMKAENVKLSGGGPCATGLVAASKLGAKCAYIGALTDDASGVFLNDDLKKYNVSTDFVTYEKGYNSFSSCIWLSKESASRTCVFFRGNIPPVKLIKLNNLNKELEQGDLLYVECLTTAKKLYKVQPFDTITSVCNKFGVSESYLKITNGIDYLFYGLVLEI